MTAQLILGPVLFNWAPDVWRDFHFRMADESDVDEICVGEIVCSKRAPFLAEHLEAVCGRIIAAGKRLTLSAPILPTLARERATVGDLIELAGAFDGAAMVEANDMGAVNALMKAGKRFRVGPFVNVYNEATLQWLAARGAESVCLNAELPLTAMKALGAAAGAAGGGAALEAQVFGRLPLAISARCYHARAHNLHKDGCRYVCGEDSNGMDVATLDGAPFLAVNGTQTMSHAWADLSAELPALKAAGISRFRLSPQDCDMVAVAKAYRAALDGTAPLFAAAEAAR
ncbi:MAG TPA: U32 family peptidase, partial [Azospirillaceae bacterium]|nr:U32 family peptidase [Azospirillaceae bacterium]